MQSSKVNSLWLSLKSEEMHGRTARRRLYELSSGDNNNLVPEFKVSEAVTARLSQSILHFIQCATARIVRSE